MQRKEYKIRNNLTEGNYKTQLLHFALPFLGANMLQALYGATDLFVVGKFNGASAIAAVNIGSQIMQIITSFIIGCAMGSTVLIGQNIGAKKEKNASRALGNTVILFACLALVLTPVMIMLSPKIILMMNTPVEAVNEAIKYTMICSIGIPFIIAFNVSAAVLRGIGDSKTPLMIVMIACVINIAGDFLLTGVFGMDTAGVAIATTSAQLISSVCGIFLMKHYGLPFKFSAKDLIPEKNILKKITFIGLPIAAQDTLINISFIILTVIANSRGLIASSAVGVVEKVIMFMFLVPSSMLSAISALTAQNIGAGKSKRAVQTLRFGIVVTVSFGIVMCALSWVCPQIFTGIFSKDSAVLIQADEYLKTYSIDCILVGFTFCINGYLCGSEKSLITFLHNVISIFAVRIPMAWFLSKTFPNSMLPMGLASPLGSLMSIIILAIYFSIVNRRKN
jgi:putative MATE family efflux protein